MQLHSPLVRRSFSFSPIARALFCLAALLLPAHAPAADEEVEEGWKAKGRIQLVDARGNAESTTAGIELALTRTWQDAELVLAAGGLLAENTTFERRAVGTTDDFDVLEEARDERAAENAHFTIDYQRHLSERWLWLAGAGWERDEIAGFTDRYSVHAGLGWKRKWTSGASLQSSLALSWVRQDDLVVSADTESEYPALRLTHHYRRKFAENGEFESRWQLDGNLDDSDDFRSDWINACRFSVSEWLSFEIEARWLYDNRPALELIPLDDGSGTPLTVAVPLDETETRLTVALVIHP